MTSTTRTELTERRDFLIQLAAWFVVAVAAGVGMCRFALWAAFGRKRATA